MIALTEFQKAIASLLRHNFINTGIYFDNVQKRQDKSFFYAQMTKSTTFVDDGWSERAITFDIAYVPLKDENKRIDRAELYGVSDKLEQALNGGLWVFGRHLMPMNTDSRIVDDVLHFSFSLLFADGEPAETKNELMQDLEIKFNKK